MSVSRELLMRFHDGEVSQAEARQVQAAIAEQPALQEELEAYADLGRFMRAWGQAHALRKVEIEDAVLRAIDTDSRRDRAALEPDGGRDEEAARGSARPREVAAARESDGGRDVTAARDSSSRGVRDRRAPLVAGLAMAGALAAGWALVAHSPSIPASGASARGGVTERALQGSLSAERVELGPGGAAPPPATIELVKFGSNAGTVFVVSTGSSQTPVVWMPDDAPLEDDSDGAVDSKRTEPL